MRAKTPTGVEVRWWENAYQHKWYVAYCNLTQVVDKKTVPCGWESGRVRQSVGEASLDGRRHRAQVHGAAA